MTSRDWLDAGGTVEALETGLALARAPLWQPGSVPGGDGDDLDGVVRRLARLRPIEYGRQREAAAKTLGCRVSDLDLEVKRERGDVEVETDTRGQGRPLDLQPPEPWPEAVDGATMLTETRRLLVRRHLRVLPEHGAVLLALMVRAHTLLYFMAIYATPATSPGDQEQRQVPGAGAGPHGGVQASLRCENITPSATFRCIEATRPTLLLIDEADQFLVEMPELVGILNGGHERGGQTIRAVLIGDAFEPRAFSTPSLPVAIAGIGRLPGTAGQSVHQIGNATSTAR